MIEVKNLSKTFGNFTAVDNIGFSIGSSHGITGLLGPNGAGKTTTMRLLTGYLRPTSGSITIDGLSPDDEESLVEIKRKIGYLAESTPLYPEMLVSEYLQFIGLMHGLKGDALEKAAGEMIEKLELGSHFYTPIGILSKGYRQRVALAGTLIHHPEVIILDEPTSGLDPNQIVEIRSLLKNLGRECTLILSTHILQEVEDVCERVIIINRGRVAADESVSFLKNIQAYMLIARGENVEQKLKSCEIVKQCNPEPTASGVPEGYERYVCELHSDEPERFFAFIASAGWEVREFSPVARSLQEIFRELTG